MHNNVAFGTAGTRPVDSAAEGQADEESPAKEEAELAAEPEASEAAADEAQPEASAREAEGGCPGFCKGPARCFVCRGSCCAHWHDANACI